MLCCGDHDYQTPALEGHSGFCWKVGGGVPHTLMDRGCPHREEGQVALASESPQPWKGHLPSWGGRGSKFPTKEGGRHWRWGCTSLLEGGIDPL